MIITDAPADVFVVFEVKMLRRMPGSGLAAGKTAYGCVEPNRKIVLSKLGSRGKSFLGEIFCSDAIEGVDFVRK